MVYYNDIDPAVCEWLRELIAAGELPPGDVDCRSITEVKPDAIRKYRQCHFFCGVGGWPLAIRWAGLEHASGIWTGSCPCQPLSCAGKRQGHADERHLWPAFHRLIAQCRPPTVFGEQVASKDGREWFAGVRLDLEDLGYACGGADLPACGVGAPHRRQRLYWVANRVGAGLEGHAGDERDGDQSRRIGTDATGPVTEGGATGGLLPCQFCGYAFDHELLGKYRCPNCEADGVADAGCQRHERRGGSGNIPSQAGGTQSEASERQRRGDAACDCRATSGVADAERDGRRLDQPGRGQEGRTTDGRAGGVGHAQGDGWNERRTESGRPERVTAAGVPDFWSKFSILPCRDGKARRIEPGTFPLVARIPRGVVSGGDPSVQEAQATAEARAMRLKGYGNAIVPQLAAEFIQAAIDAITGGR